MHTDYVTSFTNSAYAALFDRLAQRATPKAAFLNSGDVHDGPGRYQLRSGARRIRTCRLPPRLSRCRWTRAAGGGDGSGTLCAASGIGYAAGFAEDLWQPRSD